MKYYLDPLDKEILESIFNIADTHAKRLKYARDKLEPLFPISSSFINAGLEGEQIAFFELFTNRFSKLQDFIGASLLPRLLKDVGQSNDAATLIDNLNKSEKLGLIDDANSWKELRKLRNHLSHEYPDKPDVTAKYLNETYELSFILLDYFDRLKDFAKQQLDISSPA